ncbi:MAG: hypothetical protein EG826_18800, partial [Deltaproteobacteria bacterium]|nr:hypothetical protein [Deltaproteobacteria bacterium]
MCKKGFLIFCALVCLSAFVSCADWDDPFDATGDLTLCNYTSLPISAFYLTPVSAPTWGPNRLGAPVPSGASYSLTGLLAGQYDAKAVITGALSIYYGYAYGIPIYVWETTDLVAYNSGF